MEASAMAEPQQQQQAAAYGPSSDDYSRPELLGKVTSSLAEALNDDENPFAGKGVETTHSTADHSR